MNENGFTLIELLVTLAIVGVLAQLGISNMIEYKAKTYDATAKIYASYLAKEVEKNVADYGSIGAFLDKVVGEGTSDISLRKARNETWNTDVERKVFADFVPGDINDWVATVHLNRTGYIVSVGHCKGQTKAVPPYPPLGEGGAMIGGRPPHDGYDSPSVSSLTGGVDWPQFFEGSSLRCT